MAPDEYTQALDKALSDLEKNIQRRELLTAEIAGLRATVRVLSTIVPLNSGKQRQVAQALAMADYATPNLTDAIRSLLTKAHPKEMTAIEVRNELEDSSNMDDSNISLSACHAALKRMLADKEVEPGPTKDGKVSYRRVLPMPEYRRLTSISALGFLDPNDFRNVMQRPENAKAISTDNPITHLKNRSVRMRRNRAFYGEKK